MLELILAALIWLIGFVVAMVLCLVSDKKPHRKVGVYEFDECLVFCLLGWWIIIPCFILAYSYINIQKFCIYLANKF